MMANPTRITFPEPGTAEVQSKAGRARVSSARAPTIGYDIQIDYRNGGYASENRRTFSEAVLWATACVANINGGGA